MRVEIKLKMENERQNTELQLGRQNDIDKIESKIKEADNPPQKLKVENEC